MMKKLTLLIVLFCCAQVFAQTAKTKLPSFMVGNFTDDYGISYAINDSLWTQNPTTGYHIIKIDTARQYLICKNAANNKADASKYTRIDFMTFENMEPYQWGFCLTAYKAETDKIAEATATVDRENPKKGCNGYPFSRMKVTETNPWLF